MLDGNPTTESGSVVRSGSLLLILAKRAGLDYHSGRLENGCCAKVGGSVECG
jgi:hypothetical protein